MRNKRLDVLRCIAVILVLLRHSGIGFRLAWAGWVGVDLFFVLSGFLISGLLFSEYKRLGSISFKRFFIRRAFKIYPSFYAFLLATFLSEYYSYSHTMHSAGQYLSELLYVQNYGPGGIWAHTWSLAVEEHFYILLPILLLLQVRFSSNREDPFRAIPAGFLIVGTICLLFRVRMVLLNQLSLQEWQVLRKILTPTHERIDSLFFGVLIGYFHHFRSQFFDKLFLLKRNAMGLALLSAALLFPALIFSPESPFMLTAGLTMLYLGFGIVLVLCLHTRGVAPVKVIAPVGTGFAFVGMYSYSVYLWHRSVLTWGLLLLRRGFHIEVHPLTMLPFYLLASLVVGVSMSRLIEYPMLRVRDRLFPVMLLPSLERVLKP